MTQDFGLLTIFTLFDSGCDLFDNRRIRVDLPDEDSVGTPQHPCALIKHSTALPKANWRKPSVDIVDN
jgi:hypothetical protein